MLTFRYHEGGHTLVSIGNSGAVPGLQRVLDDTRGVLWIFFALDQPQKRQLM